MNVTIVMQMLQKKLQKRTIKDIWEIQIVKVFYKMEGLMNNANDLNWFDDICKWADKYNLSHEDFPRDKTLLENMIELEICNSNIEEIPPQIKHLTKLLVIMACDNNIKELPQELFN